LDTNGPIQKHIHYKKETVVVRLM